MLALISCWEGANEELWPSWSRRSRGCKRWRQRACQRMIRPLVSMLCKRMARRGQARFPRSLVARAASPLRRCCLCMQAAWVVRMPLHSAWDFLLDDHTCYSLHVLHVLTHALLRQTPLCAVYLLDEILELARSSPEQAQGVADLVEKKLGHKSPIVKFKVRLITPDCTRC